MNEDESLPILEEYDDGVVCFGPVTESQLERFKKLPRHTVIPSNFKLSQPFVGKDYDEDLDNEDESKENTTINIDDMVNTTESANNIDNEEKTGLIKLKQSFMSDNHYKSSILLDESKENTTINIDSSVNTSLSTIYHGEEKSTTESEQSCIKDSPNKSTSILLAVPENNSILFIDNSINTTQSTTYIEEKVKKETSSIKSKQSLNEDYTSEFSSPCTNQLIPSGNFIDTDVINRYIRMGSLSSNESFSGDQDISTFEDETHSYIDGQETQLTSNNSINNESISTEQSSVFSVIQRSVSEDQKNISDIADNVCTLKYCSQNEDNDLSVDSDSELENSITTDEYNVTPGKKRLFDMRIAKPSFRAKIVATAVPFMDRIEESTTPNVKSFNSSSVLFHDACNKSSETEKNLDLPTVSDISLSPSTKCVSGSNNDSFNGTRKSIGMSMEVEPANISVVGKEMHNEQTYLENISVSTVDFDITPKVDETLMNTTNVSTHEFYIEKSTNIITNKDNPITKHNAVENSVVMDGEMKSNNTSIVDGVFNDIVSSNKLSMNISTCFEPLNKTKPTEDYDAADKSIDLNNMTNVMFTRLPMADISMIVNDQNDELKSTGVKINSTTDSIVKKELDDTTFSTNDKSMNLNETKLTEDISNVSIHLSDMEKYDSIESNMILSMTEINETSKLSVSVNDSIKNSVNEVSHLESKHASDISSHVTRHLDFGQTMYELCNNISSTSSNIKSNDCNDLSPGTVSMLKQTIISETFNPVGIDSNNFSVFETPLRSNLSVIIENRTLEENESPVLNSSISENTVNEHRNIEMRKFVVNSVPEMSLSEMSISEFENSINDVPTSSISENMNETQDIRMLNKSTNKTMRESIISIGALEFKMVNEELSRNPMNSVSISSENTINENQDKEKMDKSTSESKRFIVTSVSKELIGNFFDDVSTISVSKNIANKTQDVEILDNSTNQSKRESIVISVPEISINKFENSINDMPTTISENITNEPQDVEMLDKSTNQSKRESIVVSVPEISISKFDNSINDVPKSSYSENIVNETQDVEMLNNSTYQSVSESIVSIDTIKSKVTCKELENPINNESILSENENQDKEEVFNELKSEGKSRGSVASVPEVMVENIVNKTEDVEMLNQSTNQNKRESINVDTSKSEIIEIAVANEADTFGMETKSNEVNLTHSNRMGSVLPLVKNNEVTNNIILDDIKHNVSSVIEEQQAEIKSNNSTKKENQLYDTTTEKVLISENVKKMVLNYNTNESFAQNNAVVLSNLSTSDVMPESENFHQSLIDNQEQNVLLNNDNEQGLHSLSGSINYEEKNKLKYKTPKTQKLIDFSIVHQTPASNSKTTKQKLLDFSIVHQTPTSNVQVKNRKLSNCSIVDQTMVDNMLHQTSLCENITKKDNLMDFSSVNKIWNLETVSPDVFDNDLQSTLGDFSSNNLSTVSLPNVELYADESIISNSSSLNNSKFDQTLTAADLNQSTVACEFNEPKTSTNQVGIINDGVSSTSLKKTIEYLDSKKMAKKVQSENIQCTLNTESSQLDLKSNKQTIMDFSIIEQQILQANNDKITNETVKSVESNVNLIEMSMVEIKSNKQTPSGIPVMTSNNELMVSSSGTSNTVVCQEECAHNTELITDIKMDDVSLLPDSPEKSCTSESFHSIEQELVQDNKRKIESVQEYQNNEKRMKVETEESKTPLSMLYKIRNFFQSSEKKKSYFASNTNENSLNSSNECHKKLNFSKIEKNIDTFPKPPQIQNIKSEIPVKSKIPCKVTDRSMMKNDELNSSPLLLNDCVKVKKTIPKFVGNPVLSDVSNSSMRKCPESRIPSKFHK